MFYISRVKKCISLFLEMQWKIPRSLQQSETFSFYTHTYKVKNNTSFSSFVNLSVGRKPRQNVLLAFALSQLPLLHLRTGSPTKGLWGADYSTGHLYQTQVWRWSGGVDDGTVALEFPVPLARLKVWQVVWYSPWSGMEDVLPGSGIREIKVAEFFSLTIGQQQAWWAPGSE